MEEYGISAAIFNNLLLMNTQYIESIYSDLMRSFGVFFRAIFILYTVYIGYSWFNAKSQVSVYDLLISYLIVAGVYSCVLELSWFYDVVIETAIDLTLDTSSFFISATNKLPFGESASNIHELFKYLDATILDFSAPQSGSATKIG